ncbi:MAG TPA: hypothetical protein VM529_06545, partial [Gemmata sp.]|nr:hypothetical protein [Gemmata sp.]
MPTAFDQFARAARDLAPRAAVVLGSGLGGVTAGFRESASVSFGDVPGLVPTTVSGHKGRLAVGVWADTPALLFHGRLHYYEGHARDVVTNTVRVAADRGLEELGPPVVAGADLGQGLLPRQPQGLREVRDPRLQRGDDAHVNRRLGRRLVARPRQRRVHAREQFRHTREELRRVRRRDRVPGGQRLPRVAA